MEGGRLIEGAGNTSSPVGNQAYLEPLIEFTHRVINKAGIETGFPCISLLLKEVIGEGGRIFEG